MVINVFVLPNGRVEQVSMPAISLHSQMLYGKQRLLVYWSKLFAAELLGFLKK